MGSRDVLENSPILTSTRRTGHPSAMEVNHLTAKRVIFSGRQEVRPIVTIQRLIRVVVLGLCVLALMATTLAEPVAAQVAAPTGGVVEVTGYTQVTLYDGSLGLVTVVVKGKRAAAIRSALAGLSAISSFAGLHGGRPCLQDQFSETPKGDGRHMWLPKPTALPQAS